VLILALADQHGLLPEIEPCDVVVIAGDICPLEDDTPEYQAHWLNVTFRAWLEQLPAKHVVGIAGNHDFVFLEPPEVCRDLPWTYLRDSGTEVAGLRFYGTPWIPTLGGWAFEADEETELGHVFSLIPENLDVLICHGPPYGFGDRALLLGGHGPDSFEHAGSRALLKAIDRARPRLVVFGHIHEDHGQWERGSITLANVAVLNERYEPSRPPTHFHLAEARGS
jgi:Icc-related predicted phosphoesterase